jgi:tail protein
MSGAIGTGSFNGLLFGPGYKVHVGGLQGFEDLPALLTYDVQRSDDDGAYPGTDRLGPRTLVLDFQLIGDSPADYDTLVEAVKAATVRQTAELPLYLFNSAYLVKVRPRRRSIAYDAGHRMRVGTASVEFLATDPRYYGATLHTLTTGLGVASNGLVFPATFPVSFGSGSSSGSVTATNSGTYPSKPVLTIAGPVVNPIVDNQTSGQTLSFSLTLASGDSLVIDTDKRSILLNGTASRRSSLLSGSQFFELAPGSSTIRFRNNGAFDAGALLTVAFHDAYL